MVLVILVLYCDVVVLVVYECDLFVVDVEVFD